MNVCVCAYVSGTLNIYPKIAYGNTYNANTLIQCTHTHYLSFTLKSLVLVCACDKKGTRTICSDDVYILCSYFSCCVYVGMYVFIHTFVNVANFLIFALSLVHDCVCVSVSAVS